MLETAIVFAENNPAIAAIIVGLVCVAVWWLDVAVPYLPEERRGRFAILGAVLLVGGMLWQASSASGLIWSPIETRDEFLSKFKNVVLEDAARDQSFVWRSTNELEGDIGGARTTGTWSFDERGYCREMVREATERIRRREYDERCYELQTDGKSLRFVSVGVTTQVLTPVRN